MKRQHIFTVVGGTILFGGSILSGPPAKAQDNPAPVSAPRAGDDALTCQQLTAESTALQGEMERMTREITQAAAGQMRAARAAQAASTASSIASSIVGSVPIIGGLLGSVGSRIASAGMEAQQDKMLELSERMMTRGTEVGYRLQHVEELKAARCGALPAERGSAAE